MSETPVAPAATTAEVAKTVDHPTITKAQVSSLLLEPLEAESVVLSNGPRLFNSSEELLIPMLTDGISASWLGQGEKIPFDKAAFSELKVMPSSRKSLKSITAVSNELIRSSNAPSIEPVLRSRIVKDIQAQLDTALLTGDGANDTITGLTNQPGTLKVKADPTKAAGLLAGLAMMAGKEVRPTVGFIDTASYFALLSETAADGRPLMQPDVTKAGGMQLHGVRLVPTNKMPSGMLMLADMSKVAVVRDLNPEVKVLDQLLADIDSMAIRCVTRFDLGLLYPEAVCIVKAA